jgi:hypothetical protein
MLVGMKTPGLYPPMAVWKFSGATPTIVKGLPLMRTVWPMMAGDEAKRDFQ